MSEDDKLREDFVDALLSVDARKGADEATLLKAVD